MKSTVITFLLLAGLMSNCKKADKYTDHIITVDILIKALYNSDRVVIDDILGVNPEEIGEDIEHFEFKVKETTKLLQAHGLPKKKHFKIKEYPEESADLIDVIVTVYGKGSKKEEGQITVRFVKFLSSNKIAFFQVERSLKIENTTAPPLLQD